MTHIVLSLWQAHGPLQAFLSWNTQDLNDSFAFHLEYAKASQCCRKTR